MKGVFAARFWTVRSFASVLPKKISDRGVVVIDSPLQGSFGFVAENSVTNKITSGGATPQRHDLIKIQ